MAGEIDSTKTDFTIRDGKTYGDTRPVPKQNKQKNLDVEIRKELTGGQTQDIGDIFGELSKYYNKDNKSKSSGFIKIKDVKEVPDEIEKILEDTEKNAPKLEYRNFNLFLNKNSVQKTPLEKLYRQDLLFKNPENPTSMPQ